MVREIVGGLLLLALALALFTHPALALQCTIATSEGYVADTDCDSIPDMFDNCVNKPNAGQSDMNRNGQGDACDAIMEEAALLPDAHVQGGELTRFVARIQNTRDSPIEDLSITVRNKELGIDVREQIGDVPSGQSAAISMYLRIPRCAVAKNYALTITSGFKDSFSHEQVVESQVMPLTVERSNACKTPASPFDETIIAVPSDVQMDAGEGHIIPITITNLGDQQRTYYVAAADVHSWASWRTDPKQLTVPAGHNAQVTLYIEAKEEGSAGTHPVDITITTQNITTHAAVEVSVRTPLRELQAQTPSDSTIQAIFIILALLGAIVLIALVARHYNRRHAQTGKQPANETNSSPSSTKDSPKDDDDTSSKEIPASARKRKKIAIERAEDRELETYY